MSATQKRTVTKVRYKRKRNGRAKGTKQRKGSTSKRCPACGRFM